MLFRSNGSSFHAQCEAVQMNIIFTSYNDSWNIGESWDNGYISWYSSYGVDLNQTGLNAWNVLGQLLAFQAPDLGIGGLGGQLANGALSAAVWAVIAIVVVKITLGVIPFLSGGSGD